MIKCRITDNNPLIIDFASFTALKNGKQVILKRNKKSYFVTALLEHKCLDEKTIKKVLNFFFKICTESTSPQCLWGIDGLSYNSLFLDFDKSSEKQYDENIEKLLKILKIKLEKDKKYICNVEVAYPRTWDVEYEK